MEPSTRQRPLERLVREQQCGRRVRAPAAEAGGNGDHLLDSGAPAPVSHRRPRQPLPARAERVNPRQTRRRRATVRARSRSGRRDRRAASIVATSCLPSGRLSPTTSARLILAGAGARVTRAHARGRRTRPARAPRRGRRHRVRSPPARPLPALARGDARELERVRKRLATVRERALDHALASPARQAAAVGGTRREPTRRSAAAGTPRARPRGSRSSRRRAAG